MRRKKILGYIYSLHPKLLVSLAFLDAQFLLCIQIYIMSKCITKFVYLEKPKWLIIWDGRSKQIVLKLWRSKLFCHRSIWQRLVIHQVQMTKSTYQLIKCYLLVDTNVQCSTIFVYSSCHVLKEYIIYPNLSHYLNNLAKYIEDQL